MGLDEAIKVNQYSLCSYYTEIYFNERKLSSGTCFFTKRKGRLYIVTNWHVASGRDADTGKNLDPMCGIPNKLRIFVPIDAGDDTCYYDEKCNRESVEEDDEKSVHTCLEASLCN